MLHTAVRLPLYEPVVRDAKHVHAVRPRATEALRSATAAEIERLGSVVAWAHGRPVDDLVDGSSEPGNLVSFAEGRLQSIISTLVLGSRSSSRRGPSSPQEYRQLRGEKLEKSSRRPELQHWRDTRSTTRGSRSWERPPSTPRGRALFGNWRLGRAATVSLRYGRPYPVGPAPRPSSCSRLGRKADPCTRSPLESRPSKASFARPEVAGARTRTFEDVPCTPAMLSPSCLAARGPKEPHLLASLDKPARFRVKGSRASFRQSSSG